MNKAGFLRFLLQLLGGSTPPQTHPLLVCSWLWLGTSGGPICGTGREFKGGSELKKLKGELTQNSSLFLQTQIKGFEII